MINDLSQIEVYQVINRLYSTASHKMMKMKNLEPVYFEKPLKTQHSPDMQLHKPSNFNDLLIRS